jgi:putative MATE family efflux protein
MSGFVESVPRFDQRRGAALTLPPLERIRWEVWALAWPVILAFTLDSVVGLATMLMVGRLGADAVGAVGLATQIMWAVYAGIAAVSTGTVALVARCIGATDRDGAENVLDQSLLLGVVVSVAVAVPMFVFADLLMSLFQVKGETAAMGARFLRVVMVAQPFQAVFMMCSSALRGAGDMRTPLWVSAIVNLLAILLTYALIFGTLGFPRLGLDGAAIAMIFAFGAGCALIVWTMTVRGMVLNLNWQRLRLDLSVCWRILRVGYPAALEQLIIQFGFIAYVAFIARYGEAEVAAYFIGVRILALSFLPGFGFSAAAATLVGQGLGAGDREFSRRAGWESTLLSTVLMSSLGLLMFVFAWQIAALFIDDPAVIGYTVAFMHALAAAQPMMAVDWTLTGALRGAGDSRFPLYASLAGFYGLRLVITIIVARVGGPIVWIWWSLLADYLVRSSLKTWRFWSGRWQEIEV